MKVETGKPEYKPIVITLETRDEVLTLINILKDNKLRSRNWIYADEETFAGKLEQKIQQIMKE